MADDADGLESASIRRINPNRDYEVVYWAQRFDVTVEDVRRAIEKVGPLVEDVKKELGK